MVTSLRHSTFSTRCNVRSHARTRQCQCRSSFMDKFKDFVEKTKFENWAPKSSRAWRLGQVPLPVQQELASGADSEELTENLQQRMQQLSKDAEALKDMKARPRRDRTEDQLEPFSSADDDDIAASLAARLEGGPLATPADGPLTALELAELVVGKYGNKYDMTIARRRFAGKEFVSLNIMWVHLDQRSFPMSPEQYLDKLDGICTLLNAWDRQDEVRAFLKEKAKPKNGMPARPIVGTAVALQLDLPPDVVEEWLGANIS